MDAVETKLEALLNDKSFLDELSDKNTMEEMCAAFAAHGQPMTPAGLEELAKILPSCVDQSELNEEILQEVSGGVSVVSTLKWMWKALKWGWKKGQQFADWEDSLYK